MIFFLNAQENFLACLEYLKIFFQILEADRQGIEPSPRCLRCPAWGSPPPILKYIRILRWHQACRPAFSGTEGQTCRKKTLQDMRRCWTVSSSGSWSGHFAGCCSSWRARWSTVQHLLCATNQKEHLALRWRPWLPQSLARLKPGCTSE